MRAEESKGRANLMALRRHVLAEIERDRTALVAKFNMSRWIGPPMSDPEEPSSIPGLHLAPVGSKCGTTACLFGHGVNAPELKAQGLCALVDDTGTTFLAIAENDELLLTDHDVDKMIERLFGLTSYIIGNIFYYSGDDIYDKLLKRNEQLKWSPLQLASLITPVASLITPEEAIANLDRWVKVVDEQEAWMH